MSGAPTVGVRKSLELHSYKRREKPRCRSASIFLAPQHALHAHPSRQARCWCFAHLLPTGVRVNATHPQTAHTPSPTPPEEIPGQIPNPGRDPIPDQPIDPVPDQPIDPTIPPVKDPVPGDNHPVRDPDRHPEDPPVR